MTNLGCDDKKCGFCIQLRQSLSHVCPINVWHKPDIRTTFRIRLQGLGHHQWTLVHTNVIHVIQEKRHLITIWAAKTFRNNVVKGSLTYQVWTTNANVHNISDCFTTEAFPLTTTHSLQNTHTSLVQLKVCFIGIVKNSKRRMLTWQKPFIFSRTLFTSGMTSFPSTKTGVLERFLRATWSTARPCSHT